MKTMCVYRISCLPNGNCYIGSTIDRDKRWYHHKRSLRRSNHHNLLLQRAWNKYGADAFQFEVIENVADASMLIEREAYWINELRPAFNRSLSTHAHSRGLKMGPLSEERRAKISRANTGKRHSEEERAKMRGRRVGVNLTAIQLANLRPREKGEPLSMSAREKLSQIQRGRKLSAETCAKKSAALKGKPWTEARRQAEKARKARALIAGTAGDLAIEAAR